MCASITAARFSSRTARSARSSAGLTSATLRTLSACAPPAAAAMPRVVRRLRKVDVDLRRLRGDAIGMHAEHGLARRTPAAVVEHHVQERRLVGRAIQCTVDGCENR